MSGRRYGELARDLIQIATRLLSGSSTARRLSRILPRRFRGFVRAKAGLDPRVREVSDHVRARLLESSLRETAAWRKIRTRTDWESFRDARLNALRRSLGEFPASRQPLDVKVTRTLAGDGFSIDNLVFESRPGLAVTANLYRPSDSIQPMPGILICHSHHYPKSQNELQDMGATWARCGCVVLIMDQLGHGERRQHPFRSAADHRTQFRVGRQDYFFRYNVGIQLHLIGDSLIGWMVWDLMRGVDLLLSRPGVDPARIILIGSVASGGDPAAITAALDRRITAVVPFGYGEGRIESAGSPVDVNYFGSGSWESTRNLRLSARDGFAPWVILGAVADRRLIYAHEFAWEAESDPVWARLRRIYEYYDAPDHLAAVHGSGSVSGHSPRDTHCNNVGPTHRMHIYPILERWHGIPEPVEEHQVRRSEEELLCMTPESAAELDPRPVNELAAELAATRLASARRRRSELDTAARRRALRRGLGGLLGDIRAPADPRVTSCAVERDGPVRRERVALEVEPGTTVPTVLLMPAQEQPTKLPVVVGVAREGIRRMLRDRADLVAELLRGGAAVCLAEPRGTGGTGHGDEFRGRRSAVTAASSSEMMLGQTILGARLRDLRAVLNYLRAREELDAAGIGLWGDSFAPPNPPEQDLVVPFDAEPFPAMCEPLGGLVALLGGLFEDDVRVVYLRGGLIGFASLLDSQSCYVPHDVIVPGVLRVGDLGDLAAALAPLPLRMEGLVDGLNRKTTTGALEESFQLAVEAYRHAGATGRLRIEIEASPGDEIARWILNEIR